MPIESEIKLAGRLDDLREMLEEAGARPVEERVLEDDLVFDDDSGRLEAAGQLLRLRRRDGRGGRLTFKGPVGSADLPGNAGDLKVRREWETGVEDVEAARSILEGLGFEPVVRYQKYRTRYRLEGVEVCLDETPVGDYLELEGPPAEVRRLAGRLGFEPGEYERRTYLEIHRQRGGDGDMVFER